MSAARRETSALEWARTVDLEQPVRWGRVEAEVLARAPVAEPLPLLARPAVAALVLAIALVEAASRSFAVLGLALVAAATASDSAVVWGGAALAFAAASLAQGATVRTWWVGGRRRALLPIVRGAVTVVCGVAALVVIDRGGGAGSPDSSVSPGWIAWTGRLAVLAAVLGLAVVLALLAASRRTGDPRRTPPNRGPASVAERDAYRQTREAVLGVLADRGLVALEEDEWIRMCEMPLGYWEELDDVDEAERRRILELRLVGWRDFDERDRRPWPPA